MLIAFVTLRAADPALTLQGTGTETDPYQISTAADLQHLAAACNPSAVSDAGHYSGKYFRLTADIDMAGVTGFLGIGTAPIDQTSATGWYFSGIFDGAGHRIINLTVKGVAFDATGKANTKFGANQSRKNVGVFGRLGDGGVIRNLTVDGSCHIEAVNSVGGIVGEMAPGSLVENCINYGEIVSYDQNAGGIAGAIAGTKTGKSVTVTNCINAGSVSVNNKTAGGIGGNVTYATIQNCANTGNVSAYFFNTAATKNSQTNAGGIAGNVTSAFMADCLNAGPVNAAKERAGGIAGYMILNGTGEIRHCINTGSVTAYCKYAAGQMIGGTATSGATMMDNFNACCYDAQLLSSPFLATSDILPISSEIKAKTTRELTSGTRFDGYDNWNFRQGYYPVPSALRNADLDAAAATFILLPQGETVANFVGNATINTQASGITASFAEATDLFTINGTTVSANPSKGMGTAQLILTNGNFRRPLYLTTYKVNLQGQGTETSPYLIGTKADLIHFAQLTIVPRARFVGTWFRLSADIDMERDEAFYGIALGNDPFINIAGQYFWHFDGIFDGAGHTLSNLNMRTVKYDASGVAGSWIAGTIHASGLFGSLGRGAVVKNVNIAPGSYQESYGQAGGIAGTVCGPARIENCHVATHMKILNRYAGGIFGYSATAPHIYPVEIVNCSFSGLIETNYDYVGGISSFAGHPDAKITGCANMGTIKFRHFNEVVKLATQLQRFGGIAAVNSGTVEGCVSYGSIIIDAPAECAKVDGAGGIAGQISNSGNKTASMMYNFSASQVYISGAKAVANTGALLGYRFYSPSAAASQGPVKANYCDIQLNAQPEVVGAVNPTTLINSEFHGLNTSALTSGAVIDSLASHFTFEKGYYPMPRALVQRTDVRAAAATFLLFPSDLSVREINRRITVPFNTVMPLTASLQNGNPFYIKGDKLEMYNESGKDILTLTNGTFSAIYPIEKTVTTGIGEIDSTADPVVSVRYYGIDGREISNPAPGTTVIAIGSTASGRQVTSKMIVRK